MIKQQNSNGKQKLVDNVNRKVLHNTSILNTFIRGAIQFSIKTHEGYQKQKRKGKDIPYITHPLTVGLILARVGAPDYIIVAGILHDTIEDSVPEHKVTYNMLCERFGSSVAVLVKDVTEPNKDLPWKERKRNALEHIKIMGEPSLWVKSADVISNVSEMIDDYEHDGDRIFLNFHAPKEDVITNYCAVIDALINKWTKLKEPKNPLISDLKTLTDDLANLAKKN